ncbi:MAG TPA: DinB family protein [Gemmatimonadales bacterium]|nr:DinB family protein [Gemmatimonadales bacterium]
MKGTFRLAVLAVLFIPVLPALIRSQDQPGPLAAAMRGRLTSYARNMAGAADLMPAEKFGFKPTPEQLSFGEIIAHESQSNETLCAAIAGGAQTPSESAAGATAPKDQLVARLRKSFEYCGTVIDGIRESALGDSVPFFGGRKATRARAVIALAQDWADHYAQAAMYLRLNGILPPTAQPRRTTP